MPEIIFVIDTHLYVRKRAGGFVGRGGVRAALEASKQRPRQLAYDAGGPSRATAESDWGQTTAAYLALQRARLGQVYRGWWIVALAFYSQLITIAAAGYVFGVLILSMQRDLGWSQSAIQGPLLVNRWLSGLLSVPLGPVVDRYGVRVSMSLSALLAGVGLLLVSEAQTTLAFYVAWALFGIAQPGLGLLGPRVVIANWFVRKRAKAFVIFTLGSSAAGVIAVPIATWIDIHYGWQVVWKILGILCISVAPLCWWLIRRRPEDVGLRPDGDPVEAADGSALPPVVDVASSAWTVREALRTRSFWWLTIGFLLTSMPGSAIFINISGFVQSHGFTRGMGATAVALYATGSLGARPLWGFFLDRMGLHRTLIVFGATYGFAIFVFALQTGWVQLYVTALFLGFGISGSQLLNAQALPDYFGRHIVGALTGFSTLANVAVGGSAPQIVAIVYDNTGSYVPVFLSFGIACWMAAIAFLLSPPPVHPSERAPSPDEAPSMAPSAGGR